MPCREGVGNFPVKTNMPVRVLTILVQVALKHSTWSLTSVGGPALQPGFSSGEFTAGPMWSRLRPLLHAPVNQLRDPWQQDLTSILACAWLRSGTVQYIFKALSHPVWSPRRLKALGSV